jgi:peptide/nickel transport system substrate-binding protein
MRSLLATRDPDHGMGVHNRGRYSNPTVDALLLDAARSGDMARRRSDYAEIQQILARDLPSINLWYRDTVVVHDRRLTNVVPSPTGSYRFLETATFKGGG